MYRQTLKWRNTSIEKLALISTKLASQITLLIEEKLIFARGHMARQGAAGFGNKDSGVQNASPTTHSKKNSDFSVYKGQ